MKTLSVSTNFFNTQNIKRTLAATVLAMTALTTTASCISSKEQTHDTFQTEQKSDSKNKQLFWAVGFGLFSLFCLRRGQEKGRSNFDEKRPLPDKYENYSFYNDPNFGLDENDKLSYYGDMIQGREMLELNNGVILNNNPWIYNAYFPDGYHKFVSTQPGSYSMILYDPDDNVVGTYTKTERKDKSGWDVPEASQEFAKSPLFEKYHNHLEYKQD